MNGMNWALGLFFAAGLLAPAQNEIAPKVDRYVEAYAKQRGFMGTVLVAQGGKVLVDKGYGMADLEWDVPNAPDTKFRLGSITKQFTATAILQLQEAGKLSVDDPVCKYLVECPAAWKAVTIHHLLSHTSGIPSYTEFKEFPKPQFMRVPLTPFEIVMLSKDKPMDFQPGEKWKYDNTGYVLLGHIIEKVSGEKYDEYLKAHIFDPLDMKDSGYDWTRTVLKHRASGYNWGGRNYINAGYLDMSLPHAAGSLYSTTRDLYRWDRALYTEKFLKKASIEKMFTPVQHEYAYGWGVAKQFDRKWIAHGGGINGFSTFISRFPDDDAVVIVLSNVENANAGAVAKNVAAILFDQPHEIPGEKK